MGRARFLILFFLWAIILSSPFQAEARRGVAVVPVSPSGQEVKGNQWLFVIGIDTYIDWPRLKLKDTLKAKG